MKKVKIEKITKKCVVESEYDRKSNVLKFLLEFFISYHSFFFIGNLLIQWFFVLFSGLI